MPMTTCPICQKKVRVKDGAIAAHRNWKTGKQCDGSNVEVEPESKPSNQGFN
jgi:competence CoiA-like predicted nuclease